MSRKAIAVAGLSAIAVAASGCSGDSDPEAEFRASFEKTFGEETWYDHITGMGIGDKGWLKITTDLEAPSRQGVVERTICGAASKLALDSGELGDAFTGVVVFASDGEGLGGCG